MVETTRVGLVMNGFSRKISHKQCFVAFTCDICALTDCVVSAEINGVAARPQFLVGLVRGLAGGLEPAARAQFATWLFQEAGERMPNPNDPLGTYWEERAGALATYAYDASNEVESLDYAAKAEPPVLLTAHVQSAAATMLPWLQQQEPMSGHTSKQFSVATLYAFCFL